MEDPTNQPHSIPKATHSLRGSRDLLDINILPDRFRRKKLTIIGLLPWLLLFVLLGTIYPTYQLAVQSQSTFQEKRLALTRVQADLDFYQTSSQEQADLQSQLDNAQTQKAAIIESYGGLQLSNKKWSPTLFQINQLLPDGASWIQISQQNDTIRLDGVAPEYLLVIDLLDSLNNLDNLGSVEIDSIERIDTEQVPAPTVEDGEDVVSSTEGSPTIYSFTFLIETSGEVLP